MYIGLDKENNRITADEAVRGNVYRCPVCEEQLELRQGERRMHHFAHWKGLSCTDNWTSDMSEWHLGWQRKFPKECAEVVVEYEGKKHRADILIESSKLVIEFQHSSLTAEEFKERNDFYTNCGYHIVWLFDMSDAFQKENFVLDENGEYYHWKHAWGTFWNSKSPLTNYSGEFFFDPQIDSQQHLTNLVEKQNVIDKKEMVFFENNGTVEKLLYYDSENKKVVTSNTNQKYNFRWTNHTFLMWLKKNYQPYTMYAPSCPKCKKKMELRPYSFSGFLWGCQNYGVKNIDCRERINLGLYPFSVTWDNKCPFCDERLTGSTPSVSCKKRGYKIPIHVVG